MQIPCACKVPTVPNMMLQKTPFKYNFKWQVLLSTKSVEVEVQCYSLVPNSACLESAKSVEVAA